MADIIAGGFFLLAIMALIAGFVGLIKPSIIKQDSRGKAFGKGMVVFLVSIVAFVVAIPEDESPKLEIVKTANKEQLITKQIEKTNNKVDISTVRQKADNGDADAQFDLGIAYYTGEGISQDKKEAFKWFQKSANQGHAVAQQNIGAMYMNGEGVKANQEKAIEALKKAVKLGYKDVQTALDKITIQRREVRWAVIDVLSGIYSDTNRVEKRFNNRFLSSINDNDILTAIKEAKNHKDQIRELTYKNYTPSDGKSYKDIGDKKAITDLEKLIKYSQNTNLFLQIYYDSFIEYIDNQRPTLLVKVQENLQTYQSAKILVVSKMVEIGSEYGVGYDDYKGHWRTNEDIEADKAKREKEQKEAKKQKPFIDANKYNKQTAQYTLAKFITAWQYRDFKEMGQYTQTSWRERENSPHGYLANNYDFKYLTSAKVGKVKCKNSFCDMPVIITYKNFSGKTETHTIKPNVIRENGKWGVNPISAIREY